MTIYNRAAQAVVAGCTHVALTTYANNGRDYVPVRGACVPCVEKALAAQGGAVREAVSDVARNYSLAYGTTFDLIRAAEVSA